MLATSYLGRRVKIFAARVQQALDRLMQFLQNAAAPCAR
jgi:uncharacterized protein (DUF885 family)